MERDVEGVFKRGGIGNYRKALWCLWPVIPESAIKEGLGKLQLLVIVSDQRDWRITTVEGGMLLILVSLKNLPLGLER